MIDAALLGTGGMMPLPDRYLSSMILRHNGRLILFDCGEGTQVTLKLLGWGFKPIDLICISHFHADHVSGLPGLLLTMGNSGREEAVTIAGPPGITSVVEGLCVITPELPFELRVIELPLGENTWDFGGLIFKTLPLSHGMACLAYSVEKTRPGRFDLSRAQSQNIPKKYWGKLQAGESVEFEGVKLTPDMVLGESRPGLKICYVTDTRPTDGIAGFVFGANLLVCEGLYGDQAMDEKCASHKHMSFYEAATIAAKAQVNELWLTHFSPAMREPGLWAHVPQSVFPNTVIGYDRLSATIRFLE